MGIGPEPTVREGVKLALAALCGNVCLILMGDWGLIDLSNLSDLSRFIWGVKIRHLVRAVPLGKWIGGVTRGQ